MKKIFLFGAAVLFLCATSAFADVKIGVIDLNKVLASDPKVASMQGQLKKQFDPRNQEIVSMQKNMQTSIEKYNQDSSKLKADDLKKEQQKIIGDQKKLQDLQTSFQKDLMTAQNKSMQTILKRVEGIVNKIAADQKFDLILTKASTVYNNAKFEITDQVISSLKK